MFSNDIDRKLYEQEESLKDRFVEARYGLWNSLITINGIIISSFSILSIVSASLPKLLVVPLLISCALSLILLLGNYAIMKNFYFRLGQLTSEDLSETGNKKRLTNAKRVHKKAGNGEKWAIILLLLGIGFMFLLLFTKEIKLILPWISNYM